MTREQYAANITELERHLGIIEGVLIKAASNDKLLREALQEIEGLPCERTDEAAQIARAALANSEN